MEAFKKLALFAGTTVVTVYLIVWCFDAFGFRGPISAFLINWLAVSWFAVASLVVQFSLPSRYYEIKAFEGEGQVYEHLGIRIVKKLLRRGPLAIFSPTLRLPQEKTTSALRHLDHEMRKAETIHVYTLVLMLLFILYNMLRGWFDGAGWLLVFNVLINGYPVMLQRYNRILLGELIQGQQTTA